MNRLFLIFSVALIAACASHRYSVNERVEKRFGAFQIVEVMPFSTDIETEAAKEAADELPNELVNELRGETRDGSEDRMFSEVTRSTDVTQDVLTISGRIVSFEAGSRAKRWLIGLGSGKAYASVQCTFIDKSTGETIAVATFDGELSGGFFGGSSGGAAEGVIKAIEDFIEDNY
jgi:hypothetical protein